MIKKLRKSFSAALALSLTASCLGAMAVYADVTPNPVISRNCPAYSESNPATAVAGNDEHYFSFWFAQSPDYLAYDLSEVPENERKQVLAVWYNTSSYDSIGSYVSRNMEPSDYTIEVNSAPGGEYPQSGWEVVCTVEGNTLSSRQHLVDMEGYNWIRMNISKADGEAGKQASINFDIHNVSEGVSDSWIFLGDSITAGGMNNCYGTGFATYINRIDERYFPVQENGGIGGITSTDGRNNIDRWLETYAGKYVSIAYGTNDAWGNQTGAERYYENTKYMIDAILALGKIPVLPKIPYATESGVNTYLDEYNSMIDRLYDEYGSKLVHGPDFYEIIKENTDYLSGDGVHPSSEGYEEMRRIWAETMYENVYKGTCEENVSEYLRFEDQEGRLYLVECDTAAAGEIIIPEKVNGKDVYGISSDAFDGCESVTSIVVPKTVENIENAYGVFRECKSLEAIKVDEANKDYVSVDNVLYSNNFDEFTQTGEIYELIAVPPAYPSQKLVVPEGVQYIESSAAENCLDLKEAVLPETLYSIGEFAFQSSGLESVNIPSSVRKIGEQAFNCSNLKEITVDEKNEKFCSLDGILFNKDKTQLLTYPRAKEGDSYVVPDGVEEIGRNAFWWTKLSDITVPESVVKVWSYAMYSPNIKSVTFLNPECLILKNDYIIANRREGYDYIYDGIIYGYEGSTAQEYAELFSRNFAVIGSEETVWGDANCDGTTDIADSVLIMQSIANPDKYGIGGTEETAITENGMKNADVSGNSDGITSGDALAIQKLLAGLIDSLPEKN